MGFVAEKVQAWKDHRAALDAEYIARAGIKTAKRSGDEEMKERAYQGLDDARAQQRDAGTRFWDPLTR